MKKKKASGIIVTQTSQSTNQTSEIRSFIQYYEEVNGTISFMYQENDDYRVHITFDSNQLACMRVGESNTFCWFVCDEKTPLLKDSEVGPLLLTTTTKTLQFHDNVLIVEYDLFMDQDKIDTIKMTWEMIK
jgi:uncharacterized beta-barrel protein YwiB (DUF1934 family)